MLSSCEFYYGHKGNKVLLRNRDEIEFAISKIFPILDGTLASAVSDCHKLNEPAEVKSSCSH